MVRRWLRKMGLDREPWVENITMLVGSTEIREFVQQGDAFTVKASAAATVQATPVGWVCACYKAADAIDQLSADLALVKWQSFLLVAQHDRGLRAAIETVHRLGDTTNTIAYVLECKKTLDDKLANAPFIAAMQKRQASRMRRISGRPGFAGDPMPPISDAALLAEALPPVIKKV